MVFKNIQNIGVSDVVYGKLYLEITIWSKPLLDQKTEITFTTEIVVEPDEGGFHAYCPALKGLHTCGDTREEAIQNAGYAVSAYLQSLIKHHEPIPVGVVVGKEANSKTRKVDRTGLTVACTI